MLIFKYEYLHYGINASAVISHCSRFEIKFLEFLFCIYFRVDIKVIESSDLEHVVDALAMIGDEGRDSLR